VERDLARLVGRACLGRDQVLHFLLHRHQLLLPSARALLRGEGPLLARIRCTAGHDQPGCRVDVRACLILVFGVVLSGTKTASRRLASIVSLAVASCLGRQVHALFTPDALAKAQSRAADVRSRAYRWAKLGALETHGQAVRGTGSDTASRGRRDRRHRRRYWPLARQQPETAQGCSLMKAIRRGCTTGSCGATCPTSVRSALPHPKV
jgi:hypothetical protein